MAKYSNAAILGRKINDHFFIKEAALLMSKWICRKPRMELDKYESAHFNLYYMFSKTSKIKTNAPPAPLN